MARKLAIFFIIIYSVFSVVSQRVYAQPDSVLTVKELIVKHAYELDLDPALALSIAKTESNFCHNKKSKGGAVGVFQLMPSTAKKMGYNPYHLHDNIKGGLAYYKKMYNMFGSTELALAAYNAGPGNVKKYNGIPPFIETKRFISAIMTSYDKFKEDFNDTIKKYDNKTGDVNYKTEEDNFRMQHDELIQAFLSGQGV